MTSPVQPPGDLLAIPPPHAALVALSLSTSIGHKLLAALTDFGAYFVDDTGSQQGGAAFCADPEVNDEVQREFGYSLRIENSLSPIQGAPLYDDFVAVSSSTRASAASFELMFPTFSCSARFMSWSTTRPETWAVEGLRDSRRRRRFATLEIVNGRPAMRPVVRPFVFMSRLLSLISARAARALDAFGVSAVCQRTRAFFIGPMLHGVRSHYASNNVLGFSSRGVLFLASRFPTSMTCVVPRYDDPICLIALAVACTTSPQVCDRCSCSSALLVFAVVKPCTSSRQPASAM
jgi:hypothetical protein